MKKTLFCLLILINQVWAQDVPVALLPMNKNGTLTPEKAQQIAKLPPTKSLPQITSKTAEIAWAGYASVQATAENGNPEEALKQLNSRLVIDPDDSKAAYLKGLILMQLGKPKEAERWFKMMQANFSDLPQVNNALAVIYSGQGDLIAAETTLRELLTVHPDHHSARVNLAKIYLQLAQGELEKALKKTPDDAMIARQLKALKSL